VLRRAVRCAMVRSSRAPQGAYRRAVCSGGRCAAPLSATALRRVRCGTMARVGSAVRNHGAGGLGGSAGSAPALPPPCPRPAPALSPPSPSRPAPALLPPSPSGRAW
jgi:hypothetical protein